MYEILKFTDLDHVYQQEIAKHVSNYTKGYLGETPQMLPVTPGDILNKHLGYVTMCGDAFAGYVSANQPDAWQGNSMCEVGTLWVPMGFRKQGIAQKSLKIISNNLIQLGEIPYAFCNPLSLPVFTAGDFEKADQSDIPAVAFGACGGCPMKPQSGCCDTVVVYKGKK